MRKNFACEDAKDLTATGVHSFGNSVRRIGVRMLAEIAQMEGSANSTGGGMGRYEQGHKMRKAVTLVML